MSTPHLRNCPKVNCNQKNDCCPFRKIVIPAVMGDDSEDSPSAPENGAYRNALVEYEANGAMYIYASDGIYTKISMVAGGAGAASVNYVNAQDAMVLSSAKAYADSQDAATLQAAKDYTDEHGGQGGVSQEYVDQQDASTLASAESYTDAKSVATTFYSFGGIPTNGERLVLYNDIEQTSQTTYEQFRDALLKGPVTIRSAWDGPTSVWVVSVIAAQVETNLFVDFYVTSGGGSYALYEWEQGTTEPGYRSYERLATVAATGSYNDLTNKPTIPTITMSNVDIGEGTTLAANTFYGVYE